MLPLAIGMPMMLVDHLGRSPEKQLLRGRVGRIAEIVVAGEDYVRSDDAERQLHRVPTMVVLDFGTTEWEVKGMKHPGWCQIFQTSRTWFIDSYKKKPVLAVKRWQIPLAPAFACTAHAAQGESEDAVIADLEVGRGVGSMSSYVAITRVTQRKGLLFYRPFARGPYTEGAPLGVALLMQTLRGEFVDWARIEGRHLPKRACADCGATKFKPEFG